MEDALELKALYGGIGAVAGGPDIVVHVFYALRQLKNDLAVALPCDLYSSKLYIRVTKIDDAI